MSAKNTQTVIRVAKNSPYGPVVRDSVPASKSLSPVFKLSLFVFLCIGLITTALYLCRIKNVKVETTNLNFGPLLEEALKSRVDSSNPKQNNLLFISEESIQKQLASLSPAVGEIKVKKVYPNTLEVKVTILKESIYLLQNNNTTIYLENGKKLRSFDGDQPVPEASHLIVKIASTVEQSIAPEEIQVLNLMSVEYEKLFGSRPLYVELSSASTDTPLGFLNGTSKIWPNRQTSGLLKNVPANFYFKIRLSSDQQEVWKRQSRTAKELLEAGRLTKALYIDARYPERVFVCLTTAPCAE